jgi:hypothetical protein
MDRPDSDKLTRLFATSSSRSDVLRLLAGGALAVAAAARGTRRAAAGARCFVRGKRCRHSRQCCTGNCRNGWCR